MKALTMLVCGTLVAIALVIIGAGCAQTPSGASGPGHDVPSALIDFTIRFAAAVNDSLYYFVALDTDGDFGEDGPVPVAAGPFWENGWGTGSFSHYVEYHQGRYELYRVGRTVSLRQAGGGIVGAEGEPFSVDSGIHEVKVEEITLGQAVIIGEGMIVGVTNNGQQSGGVFDIETDAAGDIVPGGISFRQNALGGRALTAAEQAIVDSLGVGGVPLATDTLSFFGISLTLDPPKAAMQTLRLDPAVGRVTDRFTSTANDRVTQFGGRLNAFATSNLPGGPIPGATLITEELKTGETAIIAAETTDTPELLGPVYTSKPPAGGNELNFTLDLNDVGGAAVDDLSVNIITTVAPVFDPNIDDPDEHTYDALGLTGEEYFTFRTDQNLTFDNNESLMPEGSDDPTLEGPADPADRAALDIVYWRVRVRKLR